MKVDVNIQEDLARAANVADVAPQQPRATYTAAAPVTQTKRDTVSVSKTASQLADAVAQVAQQPSQNASAERLSSLRSAARTGSLPLDIMALADSIIQEEGH